MNIRPIGNRVLVQALTQEEVTASGIVLPATVDNEKKAQGKIVAVGNGEEIARLGLKVGDKVVFGRYSGEEVEMDNEKFRVLNVGREKDESEVVAIIE